MPEVCRFSYLETFGEKQIREKVTREKLQEGCNNPPLVVGGLILWRVDLKWARELVVTEVSGYEFQ